MEGPDPHAVNSIRAEGADAVVGEVRWDPVHSLWNGAMLITAVIVGPVTLSLPAFTIFIVMTGVGLLVGHSVGFHRRMIHGSFQCPLWFERVLCWFGTSVGMSGPLTMIRMHDVRDWGQRQPQCHDYLANRRALLIDAWWQIHCRLDLAAPPSHDFGRVGADRFHRLMERTWMLQQLPIAAILYLAGGVGFVIWGVCARVAVSVHGHWFVGHLAHRRGPQSWLVEGAGVQAHDVPWAAIPTMGEAWHNNHHAYPGSARIGLYGGQADWGFAFIRVLERMGLAWDIQTPETLSIKRPLIAADRQQASCPVRRLLGIRRAARG